MVYYHKDNQTYNLEQCIWKHSEEWKTIFFNVLQIKVAVLANKKERMKLKEIDIHGMALDVVNEALPVFDKFLTNIKNYKKYATIDPYDNTDITLEQEVDYKVLLHPFDGFFDKLEVK